MKITFLGATHEVTGSCTFIEVGGHCGIVDYGMEQGKDVFVNQELPVAPERLDFVLLTHAHIDHIAGLRQICNHYHLPVTMHPDGGKLLRQAEAYASIMGFEVENMDGLEVREIQDNDILTLGETKIECRHVPGHCPGSICYVLHGEEAVITGDALFQGSIGRTDLPGGNYPLLIEKIKSRLLTLPDDYVVLPGHGDTSTIGDERRFNGFLL